jgi:hypothetical protein
MRKFLLTAIALVSISFVSTAKQFQVNTNVTSSDGCNWHISGTIDVGCCPSLKGYDVTISGPCGTHRFQGLQVKPGGEPSGTNEPPTNMYNMHVYTADGVEEPKDIIDTQFFMNSLMHEYYANNWNWQQ